MEINERVSEKTKTLTTDRTGEKEFRQGRIIYVHPLGRYYTVEFPVGSGFVRESFPGPAPNEERRE